MAKEEERSIAYENDIEDSNCKAFLSRLMHILQINRATDDDVAHLEEISLVIKPANIENIFSALSVSWEKIDEIVTLTLEADEEEKRQVAAEEAAEEAAALREKLIGEHKEDIDDMYAFFLNEVQLSKVNSKKVSITAVLDYSLSTAKKMAKKWSRGEVDLDALGIDRDDQEELCVALRLLLGDTGAEVAVAAAATAAAESAAAEAVAIRIAEAAAAQAAADQAAAEYAAAEEARQQQVADAAAAAYAAEYAAAEAAEAAEREAAEQAQDAIGELVKVDSSHPHLTKKASRRFKLDENGYKSFKGGWIEGMSEDQQTYYYNVATGDSAWQLPDLEPGDVEDPEEYPHEEGVEPIIEPDHTTTTELHDEAHGWVWDEDKQEYYWPHADAEQADHASAADYSVIDTNNNSAANTVDQDTVSAYSVENDEHNGGAGVVTGTGTGSKGAGAISYELDDDSGDEGHLDEASVGTAGSIEKDSNLFVAKDRKTNVFQLKVQPKPRTLPVPVKREFVTFSEEIGKELQVTLDEIWNTCHLGVDESTKYYTDQQNVYKTRREEMFAKVATRCESKLEVFVNDIKFMQKNVKQALGESTATEKDLRRKFEEGQAQPGAVAAEGLSVILESLEKLKEESNDRYESAFSQIDQFSSNWEAIKKEMTSVGFVYDEGIAANRQQCRLVSDHDNKVFCHNLLKLASDTKRMELNHVRREGIRALVKDDSIEAQMQREDLRQQQLAYYEARENRKLDMCKERGGWSREVDKELDTMGMVSIDPKDEVVPEEEFVMSFILSQVELESTVASNYDLLIKETKSKAMEMSREISDFEQMEVKMLLEDGSWFNKLRESVERHETALVTTLAKVRNKVNEGYQLLNGKIEALDLEVETAAEAELAAQGDNDVDSYPEGSTLFHAEYGPDDERNSVTTA